MISAIQVSNKSAGVSFSILIRRGIKASRFVTTDNILTTFALARGDIKPNKPLILRDDCGSYK